MTRNQLQYWANQETMRANRANERLGAIKNSIQKRFNEGMLEETSKHNTVTEGLQGIKTVGDVAKVLATIL